MYPNGQQAPGQEYCIKTWDWFCKKHNIELFIFNEPIADIEFMNPIWQKWWVMEALENAEVDFDQILHV